MQNVDNPSLFVKTCEIQELLYGSITLFCLSLRVRSTASLLLVNVIVICIIGFASSVSIVYLNMLVLPFPLSSMPNIARRNYGFCFSCLHPTLTNISAITMVPLETFIKRFSFIKYNLIILVSETGTRFYTLNTLIHFLLKLDMLRKCHSN